MQDLQLEKHQKTFGGRTPAGHAGGASALPRLLATKRGKGKGGERREAIGREGGGRG